MIYEVKMYSGKCDNCGTEIQLGGGEYSAYGEADLVQDEMADSDWHIEEMPKGEPNKHYCPDCFSIGDNDEVVIKESRKKGHQMTRTAHLACAEKYTAIIEDYKELCKVAGVPQLLIDNPSMLKSQPPSEKDIEWAKGAVKKYEAAENEKDKEIERLQRFVFNVRDWAMPMDYRGIAKMQEIAGDVLKANIALKTQTP